MRRLSEILDADLLRTDAAPGQPCTIYSDIAEQIARDPLISNLDARIAWLRKRHKRVSHLVRYQRMAKAVEVAA